MTGRINLLNLTCTVVFLGIIVFQTAYCYNRPKVSLDSFAYISLIDSGDKSSFTHAADVCSQTISGPLTGCDSADSYEFRDVASYTPQDYATFLRFYQGKPIYLWFGKILHRQIGLSPYTTLRILSAFSYFAIAYMLLLWLSRYVDYPAACVLGVCLVSLQEVLGLGKVMVSDASTTALLLVILYFLMFTSVSTLWKVFSLALLSLARADNIIFCAVYGAVILYRLSATTRTKVFQISGLVALLLALQLISERMEHALSFTTLFSHTFLSWTPPPAYVQAHLSLRQYLGVMRTVGVRAAVLNLPLPLLLAAIAFIGAPRRPLRDLLIASLIATVIRFLLFPSMEPRFYTWLVLVNAIALVGTVGGPLLKAAGANSDAKGPVTATSPT